MNLLQLIKSIENFVAKWAGTTVPRISAAFLGILICVWIGIALWEKRIRILGAIAGLVLGLFMVLIAIDPKILHFLADTSFFVRIRIMMIMLSFSVVVITVEAIRRSHLQESYAILWVTTGLIILMTAFFPRVLDYFGFLFGTQYITSVVGIVFTFLLLIVFHFSIALTSIQKKQTQIAQRCAILEAKFEVLSSQVAAMNSSRNSDETQLGEGETPAEPLQSVSQSFGDIRSKSGSAKQFPGSLIASFIIGLSFLAVLITGLITPQAMIGDEVSHYYMLVDQSKYLSQPNFYAHIPVGWGGEEVRRYPHSCLWHYLGAVVFRITGGSFHAVQFYHALFWLQFLWMAFLLAISYRDKQTSYTPTLYILVLASLPVGLIFSVAFYQDIPMAAQVLTAFYLLRKRRWMWASLFMVLAIGLKISALLFLPAFFVLMGFWEYKAGTWRHAVAALVISAIIFGSFTWGMGWVVRKYADAGFYPLRQLQKIGYLIKEKFSSPGSGPLPATTSETAKRGNAKPGGSPTEKAKTQGIKSITLYDAEIIANHPGDLRIPENFFIYGGGVLWMVVMMGGIVLLYYRHRKQVPNGNPGSQWWLSAVGIWYIAISAYFLQTAPDARFFFPGLPFLLLPFVDGVARLPRPKIIISVLATMAILQGGYVLKKTYDLRNVSVGIQDAISYLQKHAVSQPLIFMYPEGNYRLFPYAHDWYLQYQLREFWKGDNDVRIKMLRQFGIGAVVIKKHLIADVDDEITNLGVYPTYFVQDLEKDRRFQKLFENREVIIYRVPKP